jgi:hypothetical protein
MHTTGVAAPESRAPEPFSCSGIPLFALGSPLPFNLLTPKPQSKRAFFFISLKAKRP